MIYPGRVYYPKRVGWRWQVWYRQDGLPETYQASSLRHWTSHAALREADALGIAFRSGQIDAPPFTVSLAP